MGHLFFPVMLLVYARQFGPIAEEATKAWVFMIYGFVPPVQETPEYGK